MVIFHSILDYYTFGMNKLIKLKQKRKLKLLERRSLRISYMIRHKC